MCTEKLDIKGHKMAVNEYRILCQWLMLIGADESSC